MTSERLRELLKATPFKPFEIHVADGDVYQVKHRDFAWIHPGGRTIYVASGPKDEDPMAIVDILLITKLVTGGPNGNGRKKRPRS
jgi:hypothetical protein